MAKLSLKYNIASLIKARAVTDGTLYVATDSEEIFVDVGTKRVSVSDIVPVADIAALNAILAPNSSKVYYVTSTNTFYKKISSTWTPVGSGVFLSKTDLSFDGGTPQTEV